MSFLLVDILHGGEQQYIADAGRIGQQHHQTINAEAQAMAGIAPVVRRISDSRDCPFCVSHAGEYAPPLRYEIFRRHERCRCLILLEPHVGRRKQTAADAKKNRDARIARVLEAEGQLRR